MSMGKPLQSAPPKLEGEPYDSLNQSAAPDSIEPSRSSFKGCNYADAACMLLPLACQVVA